MGDFIEKIGKLTDGVNDLTRFLKAKKTQTELVESRIEKLLPDLIRLERDLFSHSDSLTRGSPEYVTAMNSAALASYCRLQFSLIKKELRDFGIGENNEI